MVSPADAASRLMPPSWPSSSSSESTAHFSEALLSSSLSFLSLRRLSGLGDVFTASVSRNGGSPFAKADRGGDELGSE